MSEESNLAVVKRYFAEVLDGGKPAVMPELFAVGAVQHFPGRTLTFSGTPPPADYTEREFHTTFHHLISDGDFVVAHLTHDVRFGTPARYRTRVGVVDISNRSVHWDAIALFHLQGNKIVEEWVNRDELDILAQLEVIQVATLT